MYKFLATIAAGLFAVSAFAQSPAPAPIKAPAAKHAMSPHAKKKVAHKAAKPHKKHMTKVKHKSVHSKHTMHKV